MRSLQPGHRARGAHVKAGGTGVAVACGWQPEDQPSPLTGSLSAGPRAFLGVSLARETAASSLPLARRAAVLSLDHGSWTPDARSAPWALLGPAADVEVRRGLALAHLPGCPQRGTRGVTSSGAGSAGASSLTSPGDVAPGTGWRPKRHHRAGTKQTDPGWKPRPHGPEVHRTERGRGRQVEGRRSQNAETAPGGSLPEPVPDRDTDPPTAPPPATGKWATDLDTS